MNSNERRVDGLPSVGESNTVMVVDDEPSALYLLRTIFAENGWSVIEATNGAEALAMYESYPQIDLIVSDINMPEMDGLSMCRQLGESEPRVPVILVSGMDIDPAIACTASECVAGFFAKPIRGSDLVATAAEMLEA